MKHTKHIIGFILVLASTVVINAQVGSWDRYPAATTIRQMVSNEQNLYIGTDGGVLEFSMAAGTFTSNPVLSEISNLDVRTVRLDPYDRLWLGMAKPGQLIQVIDFNTSEITSEDQLDLDEIRAFAVYGDSMFAAYKSGADGGVIYFKNQADTIQYMDLYPNFPPNAEALDRIVGLEIFDHRMVIITQESLIWTDFDLVDNLKDPANWTVFNPPQGVSPSLNNQVQASQMIDGKLYISQGHQLYETDLAHYTELIPDITISSNITGIFPDITGRIQFAVSNKLYSMEISSGQTQLIGSDYGTVNASLPGAGNSYWVGADNGFLNKTTAGLTEFYQPNMPLSRTFTQMCVWKDGILFGAGIEGLSMLYPFGWRVIEMANTTAQHPFNSLDPPSSRITDSLAFSRNNIWEDIIKRSDDHIFLSVQGRGVLELNPDDLSQATKYDTVNQVIEIADGHSNYVLPRQMAIDSRDNVWISVAFVSEGGQALTVISPDSSIHQIHHSEDGLGTRLPSALAIDSYDRVWVGGQYRKDEGDIESAGGLYLLDTHGDLDDESNHDWAQILTAGDVGLAGIDISQLEVDEFGYLWIRSNAGVQYLPVPSTFLPTTQLNSYVRANMSPVVWELSDYGVRQMEMDKRGNRWFLTEMNGIDVLQSNGVWMNGGYGFNTSNSGIIDDLTFSATFDPNTGLAYISTARGLAVMQTPFANPKSDYKSIHIYPQPFRPGVQEKVYIQGLMDNSTVKIVTINGTAIRELAATTGEVQGYEAVWDGRDDAGDLVGTGVYLLLYFTESGSSAVGKLAIIR